MVDSAIITLIDKNGKILGDFDLPTKVNVCELSNKLIDFLKAMDSEKYIKINTLQFEFNGRLLDDYSTLAQNGIWDGSVLKILF